MQKWKRKLVWVGAIVTALIMFPLMIPMEGYTRKIERIAAEALGVPVRIGRLNLALVPTPRLNAIDLAIGEHAEFTATRLAVLPQLTSLFSDIKVISSIQVDNPVIKKAALDIVAAMSKQPKDDSSKTPVNVRGIHISHAKLAWPDIRLPEFDAVIDLNSENMPEMARIQSVDGKLQLHLTPEKNQQLITFRAKDWILPAGPALLIDGLDMEMALTSRRLNVSKIDAMLYGGKLNGNANLAWDNTYKLDGRFKLDNLAVREPVRLMSNSTRVSGQLYSHGSFNSSANEASRLVDHLQANIQFNVSNGVLYGFDLAKAPLMLVGRGKGGETKFDAFSGTLGITGKTYRLHNLNISSGLMSAEGAIKINPNKSLDGEVEVEVKKSMSLAAIPLEISGTLENPKVFPTKAAIAGAVAGTAVLGPAGTGLGIKAGKAADKLKGLFGD